MINNDLKTEYGWSLPVQDFYFRINPSIPKGSFHLIQRKQFYYWYFKLSKGNNRLIYVCRGYPGKNEVGKTSFEQCLVLLGDKFSDNPTKVYSERKHLKPLIDEYIDYLEKEGNDSQGRRKMTTITGMRTSMRKFRGFCVEEGLRLNQVQSKDFRLIIRKWIEKLNDQNLSRNTIRKLLIDTRSFFDWLVDDDQGKGIIDNHPITTQFVINCYPRLRSEEQVEPRHFSNDHYIHMYNDCINRVRDIWIYYCNNGHIKTHPNQPVGVGTDIVYFISLFQLSCGFRVGEILNSYRNYDLWVNRSDKKSSSSYFKKESGHWFLMIKDYKTKDGIVGITHTIRSWVKPPKNIGCKEGGGGKTKYWDTNVVDVCNSIFPLSTKMFPSPNFQQKPNGTYSNTYYMNLFKSKMVDDGVGGCGWTKYGVKSSHDLRDYFISYNIIQNKLTPYELSTITRHSLSTMEKFYVRLGFQEQYEKMMKMDQGKLFKKQKTK